LIAQIYLAVTDESAKPDRGWTVESRTMIFFEELAYINRAHNWEKIREDNNEECDDLQGDKPSCLGGVNRRLMQSICGHPGMNYITKSTIDQLLKELVQSHWDDCFREIGLEDLNRLKDHLMESLWSLHHDELTVDDKILLKRFNVTEAKLDIWLREKNEKFNRKIMSWRGYFWSQLVVRENEKQVHDEYHLLKYYSQLGDRLTRAIESKVESHLSKEV
jgi:hypothetical protein